MGCMKQAIPVDRVAPVPPRSVNGVSRSAETGKAALERGSLVLTTPVHPGLARKTVCLSFPVDLS